MARILLLMRVLESTPFYQQAWLFEPYFFRVHWTAVTATRPAIPLVSPACQARRRGILSLVGEKLPPLYSPNPDHQRIWFATFSKRQCRLRDKSYECDQNPWDAGGGSREHTLGVESHRTLGDYR